MYSQKFYQTRAALAAELAELPENAGRRRAYLTLAENWRRMAEMAAADSGAARGEAAMRHPPEQCALR